VSIDQEIRGQIGELARDLRTKADLVEYFRANYPARATRTQPSWRQAIVAHLAANTGMKPKNLARRFDPSRLHNVPRTRREKEQYEALGKQIGPVAPAAYSVDFVGEVRISGECVNIHFSSLLITGEEAEHLNRTGDIYIIMRAYFQGLDMVESVDGCGEPHILITAADASAQQMPFAHGPQGSKLASVFIRA
jgi:hypothetical protein